MRESIERDADSAYSVSMSMLPPVRHSLSAELMSRIENYERRRQELLAEVARLDEKIAAAKLLLEDAPASSIREVEVPALDVPAVKPRARSQANLTAIQAMREIAMRLGRGSSEGFSAQQVLDTFQRDDRIDPQLKKIQEGYLYHVMKRFITEGLIVKISRNKYVLMEQVEGAADIRSGVVVASKDGFKMVPMTKEERVREEAGRYLSRRPNRTAHRANIADYLASNNGPLSEDRSPIKAFSMYAVRWPEFVTDGEGNYTYVDSEKTNRRGDVPADEGA
jgi:hypothetical protein